MSNRVRNVLALLLIFGMTLGFVFGGFYLIYWQRNGVPATATVTSCLRVRRADVCQGSWFVNGSVTLGTIENASRRDLGKQIDVRILGDRALIPGLRLPIVLFCIGIGIGILGWIWWVKEAPRDRRLKT